MVAMGSTLPLLLLAGSRYATASKSTPAVNIATCISRLNASNLSDQANSSWPSTQGSSIDFMIAGNTSISDLWLDDVAGYAASAGGWVLYRTAGWTLIDDGAQHRQFSTFWARFRAANSSAPFSTVCTMVAEGEESRAQNETATAAVEIQDQLREHCDENDTIALVFNSAVSNIVTNYLKGDEPVNDTMAPIPLQNVESSTLLEGFPSTNIPTFVRVAGGGCTGDTSTVAGSLSSLNGTEVLAVSLRAGGVCAGASSSPDSAYLSEARQEDNSTGWKNDLNFVIPVGVCIFLLGCAGLAYVLREKKNACTDDEPRDEVKRIITRLPYVLAMHPVV